MLVRAFLTTHCARDLGCSAHPAFPAPSDWRGREILANLGRNVPRECEGVSVLEMNGLYCHVIARSPCDDLSAVAQRAKAEAIHASASGEMDCFASLAMTEVAVAV